VDLEIQVRAVVCECLAAEELGDTGGEAANNEALGVHDIPLLLNLRRLREGAVLCSHETCILVLWFTMLPVHQPLASCFPALRCQSAELDGDPVVTKEHTSAEQQTLRRTGRLSSPIAAVSD
jgi:hypothetical protein